MVAKLSILIISLSLIFTVNAEEICVNYKPELVERDKDSEFTKENALKAAAFLKEHIEKDTGADPWYAPAIIEGYFFKRDAEIEISKGRRGDAYIQYCNFVTRQGVHRD